MREERGTAMTRKIMMLSMLLTVLGVPYSADSLVSTLFHISMLLGIKGSHANMNTIQVVASILSEIELEDKSGLIIDVVAEKLIEQLDSVRQEVVTIMQGLKDSVAEVGPADRKGRRRQEA